MLRSRLSKDVLEYLMFMFNTYLVDLYKDFVKTTVSVSIVSPYMKTERESTETETTEEIIQKLLTLPAKIKKINLEGKKLVIELE